MTVNWSGKGSYKMSGGEIRRVAAYEMGAIHCTSVKQIKREFNIKRVVLMNWVVVK